MKKYNYSEDNIDEARAYSNLTNNKRPPKANDRWTLYLVFCCVVACLSSFQFGYNIGVTNLPTNLIKEFYDVNYYNGVSRSSLPIQPSEAKTNENKAIINEEINISSGDHNNNSNNNNVVTQNDTHNNVVKKPEVESKDELNSEQNKNHDQNKEVEAHAGVSQDGDNIKNENKEKNVGAEDSENKDQNKDESLTKKDHVVIDNSNKEQEPHENSKPQDEKNNETGEQKTEELNSDEKHQDSKEQEKNANSNQEDKTKHQDESETDKQKPQEENGKANNNSVEEVNQDLKEKQPNNVEKELQNKNDELTENKSSESNNQNNEKKASAEDVVEHKGDKQERKRRDAKKQSADAPNKKFNRKIEFLWTITTCLFVFGGMIGAFCGNWILSIFGRKYGIIFHNMFTIVGALLAFLSTSLSSPVCVMVSRVFFGLQGGMSCGLIPTYLSEISPANLRGATGVIHQLFITMGILVAQVLGFRQLLGTESSWNYLLAIPIIPCVICVFFMLLFCPESPKALLMKKGREDEAREVLCKLRNTNNVSYEIEQINLEADDSCGSGDESISLFQLLKLKDYRMPLFTGLILQLTQQLCGINAVFFYSESIFRNAGITPDQIQYAVLCTGAVNVIMTVICVPLIDRLGRKPLLVVPLIIIVLDFVALTVFMLLQTPNSVYAYLSIMCIIVFIMCFAIGLGPIPFIYVAECFRQEARGAALSICMFTNWAANLLLTLVFPYMSDLLKEYVFLVFTAIVVVALVAIVLKVPETKGRTTEEIMCEFNGRSETLMMRSTYSSNNQSEDLLLHHKA